MHIKSKFCPKCGKETTELIKGLCSFCYYGENKVKIPKEIETILCKKCGAIFSNRKWVDKDSCKDYLREFLIKKIKLPKGMILDNIKIVQLGEEGKIRVWLSVRDEVFTESRDISITVTERLCDRCNIKKNKQWNSKIQLRVDKNLLNKILKTLPKEHIVKIKHVNNGVDIYLSDKDKGKSLAKKIKSKHNLKSKSSFEQRGWDRTKNTSYKLPVLLLKSD